MTTAPHHHATNGGVEPYVITRKGFIVITKVSLDKRACQLPMASIPVYYSDKGTVYHLTPV